MNLLVDVHAHLDHCYFDKDLDDTLDRAKKAGIKKIITCGLNKESNRKALALAKKYDIIEPSLGIYPVEVLKVESKKINRVVSSFDIDSEIEFIKKNKDKIISVGEVGLDYFWVKEDLDKQKDLFQKMIELSENIKKPIIVHSRKAEADCIELLESSKLKNIVMHCFSGKKTLVKKIMDNGWFFSIPANVVHSFQFQHIVKEVPISQLLTETDAPYLSPFKGKRNEPSFITETIKKIEIKKMNEQEVSENIYMNFQRIFL